jgi:hypothetical protein
MSDNRPIQLRRVIATVELDLDHHTPQHYLVDVMESLNPARQGRKGNGMYCYRPLK